MSVRDLRGGGPTNDGAAARGPDRPRSVWGPLPMVREHGAWVMLVTPLLMGLAAPGPVRSWAALGLLVLATGAIFLAQEDWRLWLPRRRKVPLNRWVPVLAVAGGLLALPLWVVWGRQDLLWIGAAGAAVLVVQSALVALPGNLDRSIWARLLAVPGITLTGPAAIVAARGQFDASAWAVWLASCGIFSSGVVFVAMLIAGARQRKPLTPAVRLRLGRTHLGWHLALALGAAAWASTLSTWGAVCVAAAALPLLARGIVGAARMTWTLPVMIRLGLIETAVTTWSASWVVAALYVG